ncbi:hypothetical protein [Hoyosella altamirensis]|uniref:hypothetical protein n=1 Tax=Hoyosella altamirensis TaxID=616997 RepID=UPI0007DB38C8|nr:hypothetical protein [Hoyosella altamirensis]
MIYVGLDLSLTSTGVAIITKDGIFPRRIQSKGKKTDSWATRYQRLTMLAGEIADCVPPRSVVAVESPSYASNVSASQHDRSGLWWLVYRQLMLNKQCTIVPVAPTVRAKYATGKGNAGKDAVLAAVVRRYTQVDTDINGNDVADAVVLAAIAARLWGDPVEDALPRTHLDALTKLEATVAA